MIGIVCTYSLKFLEVAIMDPIYVTGHKNPDTDSIVAAMA